MYTDDISVIKSIMPTVKVPSVVVAPTTVDSFITEAIKNNAPVETMERLFALHREAKSDIAREAFVNAMATFQSQCPTIEKTKHVLGKDGKVRYSYAPLDTVVAQVKELLVKNGLAYTIDAQVTENSVTAVCKITHTLGHSETSTFGVPVDKDGYMTAPQKVASALTFAKRYAFVNALGILTGDEDTDSTDVQKEKAPKDVKAQIVFLLRQIGVPCKTKDDIVGSVKSLTTLDLVAENYTEICNRLSVVVDERNNA